MAKYNAAKHTIESDEGRTLATLTVEVETSQAWEIADGWSRYSEELNALREEVSGERSAKLYWTDRANELDADLSEVRRKLEVAQCRIEELEGEIAGLKEKGAPDA